MKILKLIGIISLITSYSFLTLNILLENFDNYSYLFYIAWASGILSVISNFVYAIRIGINDMTISTFGFCGLIWFVPSFLSESFGIISMTLFLIIGIYIHIKKKETLV